MYSNYSYCVNRYHQIFFLVEKQIMLGLGYYIVVRNTGSISFVCWMLGDIPVLQIAKYLNCVCIPRRKITFQLSEIPRKITVY